MDPARDRDPPINDNKSQTLWGVADNKELQKERARLDSPTQPCWELLSAAAPSFLFQTHNKGNPTGLKLPRADADLGRG